MSRFRTVLFSLCFVALLSGCERETVPPQQPTKVQNTDLDIHQTGETTTVAETPLTVEQANRETPQLKGGPEKTARSTDSSLVTRLNSMYPAIVFYHGSRFAKEVSLTFDDGPDAHFTPQILNILKRYHVKATFFIVGNRAQAHPEMVRRILRDGHAIGNHTWDHPDLAKLSPGQIRTEVSRTDDLLNSLIGYRPAIFRPPYGLAPSRVVEELGSMGYRIVDWSVDTRDWAGTPTPQIIRYVRQEIYPGGIVLEHCAGGKGEDLSNTVRALPQIISLLSAKGYRFVTIPELLHIPASMR